MMMSRVNAGQEIIEYHFHAIICHVIITQYVNFSTSYALLYSVRYVWDPFIHVFYHYNSLDIIKESKSVWCVYTDAFKSSNISRIIYK